MNLFKSLFCFVALVLIQSITYAQQEWISYQSQQQINDLVDNGTELLLATDRGLVVMDKNTLQKSFFDNANTNLDNHHIQAITMDFSGNSWIGTYDMRVAQFDGSEFQNIEIPNGIDNPNTIVLYDIEVGPDGDLWVGSSEGVFHKEGNTWNKYAEDELGIDFFEVWDIEINDAGEVFIASQNIHKYANGTWEDIGTNATILPYAHANLHISSTGDLFICGDLDKIGRYNGSTWELYDFEEGFNGFEVVGFTEDMNGNIYYNTLYDGIFKLENNEWSVYSDEQTIANGNNTSFYYIDAQNNSWLNNNIYLSVNKDGNIQSSNISAYTIEYNNVDRIQKGLNGDMFFLMYSSTSSIAVVDNNGNWSSFSLPQDLYLWPSIGDILYLAADDVWIASYDGLFHYNGTDWLLKAGNTQDILMDSEGKIYARANDRIYIIDNGIVSEYNTSNSQLSNLILSGIGVDTNDNLWIASFDWDGNAAIQKTSSDGNNWMTYSQTEYDVIDRPSGEFHFDNNGNVWIPSDLAGVLKFDGNTWTNPIKDNIEQVVNYNAFAIESDASGTLYFAHQYGVSTLKDGVWDNLIIDDVPNENSSATADIEFDDSGTLWWANNRHGVFSYTPESTSSIFSNSNLDINLSLYPNPAQNYFIIDFAIEENSEIDVYIYNNIGQLMSQYNFGKISFGEHQEKIELVNYSQGIYTVELKINNKSTVKRLVVQSNQ